MTEVQDKTIERLRKAIFEHDAHSSEYEYKIFEIQELNYRTISLITEIGLKSDEGTMASIFARTRRHIFIGPRGGIQLANAKDYRRKGNYSRNNWPRGFRNAVHMVTV